MSGGIEQLDAVPGFACMLVLTPPPGLLILDEPTNHLGLKGIAALAAYDGAALAISHDERFLAALAAERTI